MDLSVIQYPKFEEIKSALFIQPHPDDNEIGAGGAMALLAKRGIPVYGLTVTEGRGGSDIYTPEQLSEIRKNEADDAMKITGAINLGDLGYHNTNPIVHEKLVEDIVRVIRQVKPDAIFTIDPYLPNEMHPVHIKTGKAVEEAYLRCGQKSYPFHEDWQHEDAFKPRTLGFYYTEDDNTIVDITEVFNTKLDAIRAHHSQMQENDVLMLKKLFELTSADQNGKIVERFKLLSNLHTHAFAMPKFIRDELKKQNNGR